VYNLTWIKVPLAYVGQKILAKETHTMRIWGFAVAAIALAASVLMSPAARAQQRPNIVII
jgi:hypothetical protein